MSDIDQARQQAEENFRRSRQTQMAEEQQIRDAALHEAFGCTCLCNICMQKMGQHCGVRERGCSV